MLFQTHYTHTPSPPEKNSGEKLVEVAGYISAQQRIELILAAGRRLNEYRKEQFDFVDGKIDEDFYDPTRSKNFDLADGTQLGYVTHSNLRASKLQHEAELEQAKRDALEKLSAQDQLKPAE